MIVILRGWELCGCLYGNEVAASLVLGGMIFWEKEAFEMRMRGRK